MCEQFTIAENYDFIRCLKGAVKMLNEVESEGWWKKRDVDDHQNESLDSLLQVDDVNLENILDNLLNISEETEHLIAEQYPYLKVDSISPKDNPFEQQQIQTTYKHPNNEKQFKCDKCAMEFSHRYKVSRHRKTHDRTETFQCHHCGKIFSHRNSLVLHVKSHAQECRGNECSFCYNLLVHRCNVCNMEFFAREQLRKHKKFHNDDADLKCEFCDKVFSLPRYLSLHRKAHFRNREFRCDQCLKEFSNRKTFKAHLICHSMERVYRCDVCESRFQRKNALIEHKKLHSKAKEYICRMCDRAFAQFAGLYTHMKVHKAEE